MEQPANSDGGAFLVAGALGTRQERLQPGRLDPDGVGDPDVPQIPALTQL